MRPDHRIRWLVAALVVGGAGLITALVVSRNGTREVTIPSGTRIVGALDQGLSPERNKVGDRITISTTEPTDIASDTELPAGISLDGEITDTNEGDRLTGAPELTIRFDRLTVQGRSYSISAEPFRLRGAGLRLRVELSNPVTIRFRPEPAGEDTTKR